MAYPCGCYCRTLISGVRRETKPLTLLDVAAHTTILSTASTTTLEQTFVNPSNTEEISESRYVFPLYDGISVTSFTCKVGLRTIRGVVKEKVRAEKVYAEAVSRGETAGLLQQGPTTDVFVTNIGHIPAGEQVRVRLQYVGELKHDMAIMGTRFTIPTYISPRYEHDGAPQDTWSISEGRIAITVDISMPNGCPIQEVRSPSHPIALSLGKISTSNQDEASRLSMASATLSLGSSTLDKDFVLEICFKDSGNPKAMLETHPDTKGQRALMTTLVPSNMGNSEGEKPEIIIVADQSGSMTGPRTATLVAALHVFLKSLPVGTNFNICCFGTGCTFLWKKSNIYNEKSLKEALKFISRFNGSHGGTETLKAVAASIKSRDIHQNLSLILATDGDIWQQEQLFSYLNDQLTASQKGIRVFPLGIGNSVSSGLIEGVARAGNGFAQSVAEGEKLDTKVIRMLKGALTPDSGTFTMEVQYEKDNDEDEYDIIERVTDSLRVITFDDNSPDRSPKHDVQPSATVIDSIASNDAAEDKPEPATAVAAPKLLQSPQVVPPLYPLSRTTVYILLSPEATRATPKAVVLRNDTPENPFEIKIPVEVLSEPGTTIHSLAAKRAILELEEGRGWLSQAKDSKGTLLKNAQTSDQFLKMVKKEAVRLGVEHQITGKYTSSVAVQDPKTPSEKSSEPTEKETAKFSDSVSATTSRGNEDEPWTFESGAYSPFADQGAFSKPRSGEGGLAGVRHRVSSDGGSQSESSAGYSYFSLTSENSPGSGPSIGDSSKFGAPSAPAPLMRIPIISSRTSATSTSPSPRSMASYGGTESARSYSTASAAPNPQHAVRSSKQKLKKFLGMADYDQGTPSSGVMNEPSDVMHELIALQSFDGFWALDFKLKKVLGVSKDDAPAPKRCQPNVWATLLAIAYLEDKMAGEKEAWEMVVEKALAWIDTQGVGEEDVKGWKAEAVKALRAA